MTAVNARERFVIIDEDLGGCIGRNNTANTPTGRNSVKGLVGAKFGRFLRDGSPKKRVGKVINEGTSVVPYSDEKRESTDFTTLRRAHV